jgi:hypothetical protein
MLELIEGEIRAILGRPAFEASRNYTRDLNLSMYKRQRESESYYHDDWVMSGQALLRQLVSNRECGILGRLA